MLEDLGTKIEKELSKLGLSQCKTKKKCKSFKVSSSCIEGYNGIHDGIKYRENVFNKNDPDNLRPLVFRCEYLDNIFTNIVVYFSYNTDNLSDIAISLHLIQDNYFARFNRKKILYYALFEECYPSIHANIVSNIFEEFLSVHFRISPDSFFDESMMSQTPFDTHNPVFHERIPHVFHEIVKKIMIQLEVYIQTRISSLTFYEWWNNVNRTNNHVSKYMLNIDTFKEVMSFIL